MPIYEYECSVCYFNFEKRQRFSDEPVAICPKCRGKAHRILNSVPIIFKGSGFYTTDSRKHRTSEKAEKEVPGKDKGKESKE